MGGATAGHAQEMAVPAPAVLIALAYVILSLLREEQKRYNPTKVSERIAAGRRHVHWLFWTLHALFKSCALS
jgi:hypothetical protein